MTVECTRQGVAIADNRMYYGVVVIFFHSGCFILISSNYFPNRSNRSLLCIFALSGTLERELIFKTHRVSSIVV